MAKPILLYFYVKRSTFIGRDIEMLSGKYEVLEQAFDVSPKWRLPLAFMQQLWFLIRHGRKAMASVTHIAGFVSFLPALWNRLFGLRALVVIAGTDGARFPAIRYGNFNRKLMGWFTRMSYRWAAHLAPVDESLVDVAYTYDAAGAPRQGYRHFCPEVETPCSVVWYGYDADAWRFDLTPRPKDSFITVIAGLDSEAVFLRKGVDLILAAAVLVPEARFTLVGAGPDNPWVQNRPANVDIHPVTDRSGLMDLLNRHRFYLQLSLMEGFPNALCEAMLCGCVPIGSNVAAIPFIIGETGHVLQRKDPALLAELLREAMADGGKTGMAARERIATNFPASLRLSRLIRLIEGEVEQGG